MHALTTRAENSAAGWKNDLWIAALAAVQNAVVVTTDQDFDHLNPQLVAVERIDVATLAVTA